MSQSQVKSQAVNEDECPNCSRLNKMCFHCRQKMTWGTESRPYDSAGDYIHGDIDGPDWDQRFLDRVKKVIGHEPPAGSGWADHRYREWDKDSTPIYVSHPYSLKSSDFRDFIALESAGFRVYVSGSSAYFPGRSVRVEVRLPSSKTPTP